MKRMALALLLPLLLAGCFDYSEGDRAGTITKLSRKGFFCKTWEGSANLGGMKKITVTSSDGKSTMDQTVPNTFDFTIEDPNLLPLIVAAMDSGQRVKLSYREELFTFCRSDSNDYFVTGVE